MKIDEILLNNNEIKELELSDISALNITLKSDAKLTLKLAYFAAFEKISLNAKLMANAELNVVFADFSKCDVNANCLVDLCEEGAKCSWRLASLANGNNKKRFDVSFNHLVGNTISNMDNYGVAKGLSMIDFCGTDHIFEHAKKSQAKQNAKIIVFDEKSMGRAAPILKIDENDVTASHGATVGQLSDEHMFYLMSRGLSFEESRRLITFGYLKPISLYFSSLVQQKMEQTILEDD